MKCQILFSGENKKNISICHLLKSLHRVLSINDVDMEYMTFCMQVANRKTHDH